MNSELAAVLRARGALFFSAFGALWLLAWACFSHHLPLAALIVPAALGLIFTSVRRTRGQRDVLAAYEKTPEYARGRRVFHWTNAAQWLGIAVGINVLNNTGLGAWGVPLIVMIVGLHMFPLAWAFNHRPHAVTGAALVLLAAVCPFVAPDGPADTVICAGAGLILWSSAAWALRPRAAVAGLAGAA